MTTAPEGAAPEEIRSRLDNAEDSLPNEASQQKTHPLVKELRRRRVRLHRLVAKLDALVIWRDDLLDRVAVAEEKLHADGNLYFSRLYPDELDALIDGVRAWRLAAGRVVLDLDARGLGDVRRLA